MSPFVAAVAILGGVALGLTVLHWLAEAVKRSVLAEDRLEQLRAEVELERRQAEAMQKDVSNEDVARSLDRGEF